VISCYESDGSMGEPTADKPLPGTIPETSLLDHGLGTTPAGVARRQKSREGLPCLAGKRHTFNLNLHPGTCAATGRLYAMCDG
jgi:hypothetical protein